MEEYSLIDVWRSKNPGKLQYTWHSKVEEPRKVTIYMAFKGRRTQESYNIHGIQRSKNPGKLQYTWHSNNRPLVFSRLDYRFNDR